MSSFNERKIFALIVTFERRALLEKCLLALAAQTQPLDAVLVVDNASTDGTSHWLTRWLPLHLPQAKLIALQQNTGGAGGFSEGLRIAMEGGADWVWMMDDDAEPRADALFELMQVATIPNNIYGSLPINGSETSWPITLQGDTPKKTSQTHDIPEQANVRMLPFLGFLVHRNLVAKIGLPDPDFFIAADDVEYCTRAQKAGAKVIVAGKSRIEHPKSRPYEVRLPCYTLTCIELPPWKRYYDTRNRLLIARKYDGVRLFTRTIPGSFVRLIAALVKEQNKLAQLKAFFAGFVDGLLGRRGRRHEIWGIK